jgi:hypothetical protein
VSDRHCISCQSTERLRISSNLQNVLLFPKHHILTSASRLFAFRSRAAFAFVESLQRVGKERVGETFEFRRKRRKVGLGAVCDCGILSSQRCAEEGGQKGERDLHLPVTWYARWRSWSSLAVAIYTASPILFTRVVYTLRDHAGKKPEDRRVSFRLWRQPPMGAVLQRTRFLSTGAVLS